MKEILRALGPVKRRIRRNRLLSGAAAGLAAGLGAAVLLRIVSFFVPLQDRLLLCGAVAAGVTLIAAAAHVSSSIGVAPETQTTISQKRLPSCSIIKPKAPGCAT